MAVASVKQNLKESGWCLSPRRFLFYGGGG